MIDFPLLYSYNRAESHLRARLPSVPWDFVAPHAEQAKRNHDQTLAQLAKRGGLAPTELLLVIAHLPIASLIRGERGEDAEARAVEILEACVRVWRAALLLVD